MIAAAYEKSFPDVWTAVSEFGYVVDQLKIEVNYMERRADDERSVAYDFKTPERAEAYIDAVEQLSEEMNEILMRFKQISGIED
jgi:hypothetical protein